MALILADVARRARHGARMATPTRSRAGRIDPASRRGIPRRARLGQCRATTVLASLQQAGRLEQGDYMTLQA